MTRDRLKELLQAIDVEKQANGDAVISIDYDFLNDGFDAANEEELSEVLDKIETVWAVVYRLQDDIADLKQLHADILNSAWTSEKVTAALEDKNKEIQLSITIARSKLEELIKRVPKEQAEGYEPVAIRTLRIHCNSLQRAVHDVIVKYNTALMKHQEQCAELVRQQMRIVRRSVTNEEFIQKIENGVKNPFTDNILLESMVAKQALTDLYTRQKELQEVENSLQELRNMFVNMSVLINEQGEVIDNIENEVKKTKDYVVKAQVQVQTAKKLRKKYRKTKWCLIYVAVTVILIVTAVLLYIYLPRSTSSDTTSAPSIETTNAP